MSEKIVYLNEELIKVELKELVRSSIEETLNGLLEQEAQQLTKGSTEKEVLTYLANSLKHEFYSQKPPIKIFYELGIEK